MNRFVSKMSIEELLKRRNSINLSPEYQTAVRWTEIKQSRLIDSIMRGFSLPKFVFHRKKRNNGTELDTLDSKQRQTSIYSFYDDKVATEDGRSFSDLPQNEKDAFLGYEIDIEEWNATDEEAVQIFLRLQEGVPLSPQEKRDANLHSSVRSLTRKVMNHPFVVNMPMRGRSRTAYSDVASRLVFWASQGFRVRCDNRNLNDFWEQEVDEKAPEMVRMFESLDVMEATFAENRVIFGHTFLGDVFQLVSSLLEGGEDKNELIKNVGPFIKNFEAMRRVEKPKGIYKQFTAISGSRALDLKNVMSRHNILTKAYYEAVSSPQESLAA